VFNATPRADRPYWRSAPSVQKRDPVAFQVGAHQAKTRKPRFGFQRAGRAVLGHVKVVGGIDHLAGGGAVNDEHLDRLAEIGPQMKELHRGIADGHRRFGAKADAPMRVIVDLFQNLGVLDRGRHIGLARQRRRAGGQHVKAELGRRRQHRRHRRNSGGGGGLLGGSGDGRHQGGQKGQGGEVAVEHRQGKLHG
jgi:hypothetical protein